MDKQTPLKKASPVYSGRYNYTRDQNTKTNTRVNAMLSRLQISHSFSHSKGNVNEAHAAKAGLIVNFKQIGILWYSENIILSKIYGILRIILSELSRQLKTKYKNTKKMEPTTIVQRQLRQWRVGYFSSSFLFMLSLLHSHIYFFFCPNPNLF